tara:strand:+ start:136 stop:1086 length:951 start_codon:yes stop_codon:yes gene_type:complete
MGASDMNVLSLFNGMSFGRMALDTMGVKVDNYYSSEIDKYANQAAQALFPDTIQLGDVTQWRDWDIDWASIDLVTGGFPCQAWSMAGKQLGDKDERGMLFWVMLDIMKHVRYHNPKADFLIENVKMKKEFEEYITTHTENALGHVYKVLINSALVSAQNRNRYYWTSFAVEQPEDKYIFLNDIIESVCMDVNSDGWHKWWNEKKEFQIKKKYSAICNDGSINKAITLTARQYASWSGNFILARTPCKFVGMKRVDYDLYRKLTVRENMRLQAVPEHHIDTLLNAGISNTQLYKMCGNGWTHDVITHILKHKFKESK